MANVKFFLFWLWPTLPGTKKKCALYIDFAGNGGFMLIAIETKYGSMKA